MNVMKEATSNTTKAARKGSTKNTETGTHFAFLWVNLMNVLNYDT